MTTSARKPALVRRRAARARAASEGSSRPRRRPTGPYETGRRILRILKVATIVLAIVSVLFSLVTGLWTAFQLSADDALYAILVTLLQGAQILLAFMLVYVILLAIGATFDNADQTRGALALHREMREALREEPASPDGITWDVPPEGERAERVGG